MIRRLTNSELQDFKDCRRRWYLGWHRRLRPRAHQYGAASVGTRVHKALEANATGGEAMARLDELYAEEHAALVEAGAPVDVLQKEDQLARIMVQGYFEWLEDTGANQGYTLVAAEQKAEVPFGEELTPAMKLAGWTEVRVMGKLDERLRREQDGAVVFNDYKTVGGFDDRLLDLNEQVQHYGLIHRMLVASGLLAEEVAAGGLWTRLKKVKRTARATPPFYDRVQINLSDKKLRNFYRRLWAEAEDLALLEVRLLHGEDPRFAAYPRPSRDCTWKCPFLPVCSMFDNDEDAEGFLAAFYEEGDPLDRYDLEDKHED